MEILEFLRQNKKNIIIESASIYGDWACVYYGDKNRYNCHYVELYFMEVRDVLIVYDINLFGDEDDYDNDDSTVDINHYICSLIIEYLAKSNSVLYTLNQPFNYADTRDEFRNHRTGNDIGIYYKDK